MSRYLENLKIDRNNLEEKIKSVNEFETLYTILIYTSSRLQKLGHTCDLAFKKGNVIFVKIVRIAYRIADYCY